jgi:hypothetical protein
MAIYVIELTVDDAYDSKEEEIQAGKDYIVDSLDSSGTHVRILSAHLSKADALPITS